VSIDLRAANVVKDEAVKAWKIMQAMIEQGQAEDAWIHIAWAILDEREACATIAATAPDVAAAIRARSDPRAPLTSPASP
jgi:hypothetical protein